MKGLVFVLSSGFFNSTKSKRNMFYQNCEERLEVEEGRHLRGVVPADQEAKNLAQTRKEFKKEKSL